MRVTMVARRLLVLSLVVLGCAVGGWDVAFAEEGLRELSIEVYSSRSEYSLGELVRLRIRMVNRSDQPITLRELPSVANGRVRVLVAEGDGEFRKYLGPGWSLLDVVGGVPVEIAPQEAIETEATILYNHRKETKHLSELYAKQIAREYVDSDYAFGRPGVYRVRVALVGEDISETLMSKPVPIQVTEPQGADRQVWEALKDDVELGYFIQAGGPKGDPGSAKSIKQAEVLSKLSASYPDSRQANDIRLSLARYDDTLRRMREVKLMQE